MRLLLVEDDSMIGESIRQGLRQDGFTVDWAQDGRVAEQALASEPYDLLLLDLGLPRKSGLDLLKDVRRRGNTLPILIVTARDSVTDRVAGLDSGADDYLVKPFDLDELAARIRALLRRYSGRAQPLITYGGLHLNPATHEVIFQDRNIMLSAREFALLHTLIKSPGVILSRAQLEEKLYGWGEEVESNTLVVHIHNLRKKLGANVIRNVRGVGYVIVTTK